MTLNELFLDAFQESSVGTITQPRFTFSAGDNVSAEIGTSYDRPTATFTITDVGLYQYGPETGIEFTSVEVAETDSDYNKIINENKVSNTEPLVKNGKVEVQAYGSGDTEVHGSESKTYYFKATYSYSEGDTPNTNLGTTAPLSKIPAVSDDETTSITYNAGWRQGCFYGTSKTVKSASDIDGWLIRNLSGKINSNYTSETNLLCNVGVGDTAIIIACPNDKTGPISVYNASVNAEMFNEANFKTMEVEVGGADATSASVGNYPAIYKVWYYIPAQAYSSTASLQIDLG